MVESSLVLRCIVELLFDPKFLNAVKKVGKILSKDKECIEFLKKSTEEITKEKITIRFGSLYTDKTEIIKVVRDNNIYYLQRYYG